MRKILVSACALALAASPAFAGVTGNNPVTPQTPNMGYQNFVQGTDATATYKTLYTGNNSGAAAGSKCYAPIETNTDGSATHVITLAIHDGSADYIIGTFTTASNDGNSSTVPSKNVFTAAALFTAASPNAGPLPVDGNGNAYIKLKPGDLLEAQYATALTSSTRINFVVPCDDY